MCKEINKKLFSEFDKINLKTNSGNDYLLNGQTFRNNIDILLILLNNAIHHSGFENQLDKLAIQCTLTSDNNYLHFIVENNLSSSINIEELKERLTKINNDYRNGVYQKLNTRQEGGMGLYKIMIILYNTLQIEDGLYLSINEQLFRAEIKIKKELICYEKNTVN